MIIHQGNKWLLKDKHSDKTLGTHDSFQKALKQEYAVLKSMGKSKEEIQAAIDEEVARNYKKASASNGYVALKLDKQHAKIIHAAAKAAGIKNLIPEDEMHMTLMYDESDSPKNYVASSASYDADITGCTKLGKPGSKWEAIVIEIDSPEISARFKDLKKAGFKHSYGELKQHISIKYKPEKDDLSKLKKAIDVLKQHLPRLKLSNEYTESIVDDATKKASLLAQLQQDIVKTAAIKLSPFKALKDINIPWYKKFLNKHIVLNNPDIQDALKQSTSDGLGRLTRLLDTLKFRK